MNAAVGSGMVGAAASPALNLGASIIMLFWPNLELASVRRARNCRGDDGGAGDPAPPLLLLARVQAEGDTGQAGKQVACVTRGAIHPEPERGAQLRRRRLPVHRGFRAGDVRLSKERPACTARRAIETRVTSHHRVRPRHRRPVPDRCWRPLISPTSKTRRRRTGALRLR